MFQVLVLMKFAQLKRTYDRQGSGCGRGHVGLGANPPAAKQIL